MESTIRFNFLGVGSAFSKKHGNTSAIVTVENKNGKKNLLIDCGRTTPDDLVRSGYTWEDIDAIFITHLHGDHVYGLEEAGFMGKYVLDRKPHIIFPHKKIKNDLWDKVLKGTMMNAGGKNLNFNDYFTYECVEEEDEYFIFNEVMFSVYPTVHIQNKKSYGLIIGETGYVIYTADSLLNKDLIGIAVEDGCQAIFHDCQFAHNEGRVHASLDDLISLSEKCREKIFIMHYGDDLAENHTKIKDASLNITARNTEYEFKIYSLQTP